MTSATGSTAVLAARNSVGRIMNSVLLALLPGALAQAWLLGIGVLWHAGFAMAIAMAAESLALRWRGQPVAPFIRDSSAQVTAAVLSLLLPPTLPLWMLGLAVLVAVLIGKQLYGGLGENVFNPAMLGLAVVLALAPGSFDPTVFAPVANSAGGAGWISVAYALGGVFLLARRIIAWQSPVAMLAGALFTSLLLGLGRHALASTFSWPLVLAAFFVVTDPVTGAMGARGRTIFAGGTGILVMAVAEFGGGIVAALPFAVLSMNVMAPWLDLRSRRAKSRLP